MSGSSPRVWGTPRKPHGCLQAPPVHPHGCGERTWGHPLRSLRPGSSPRVWGTRRWRRRIGTARRFIPTGVGNATAEINVLSQPTGSSPRVWGTPHHKDKTPSLTRFIPTGVGNARCSRLCPAGSSVHPHGCGERRSISTGAWSNFGSSPRVWGTRLESAGSCNTARFIPTGVGNAIRAVGISEAVAVHPHGCGERTNHNRLISKRKIRLKNSTDFYAVVGVWQVSDF